MTTINAGTGIVPVPVEATTQLDAGDLNQQDVDDLAAAIAAENGAVADPAAEAQELANLELMLADVLGTYGSQFITNKIDGAENGPNNEGTINAEKKEDKNGTHA